MCSTTDLHEGGPVLATIWIVAELLNNLQGDRHLGGKGFEGNPKTIC
jgi:hypothetical protein